MFFQIQAKISTENVSNQKNVNNQNSVDGREILCADKFYIHLVEVKKVFLDICFHKENY